MSYGRVGRGLIIAAIVFVAILQPAHANKSPSGQQPDNVNVTAPQQTTSDNQMPKSFWGRTTDDPIALYTFLLACFTLVLAFVSALQGYFLFRADGTARISADAAKQSADALPKLERAYVFVEDTGPFMNVDPSCVGLPYTHIKLINHGKTPAILKHLSFEMSHLVNCPDGTSYATILDREEVIAKEASIEHGISLNTRRELTASEMTDITNEKSFLWLWGKVVYEDVFGNEHKTAFCMRYNGKSQSVTREGGKKYNYRT